MLKARFFTAGAVPYKVSAEVRLIGADLLVVITGGVLSWFASTHPDGLEWSIEKVTGKGELPGTEDGIAAVLKGIQEKTAFLPGYNFRPSETGPETEGTAPAWPGIDSGTSTAGVIGGVIVVAMVGFIGAGIRFFRRGDPSR